MKECKLTAPLFSIGIFVAIVALLQQVCPANGTEILFEGDEALSHIVSPLPYTYIDEDSLPQSFDWGHVEGKSYLTHMLNQHIPQVRRSGFFIVLCRLFCSRKMHFL